MVLQGRFSVFTSSQLNKTVILFNCMYKKMDLSISEKQNPTSSASNK
jgi:hypothetical protein